MTQSLAPSTPPPSLKPYFVVAFLEGAAVMAVELCGAKLIAPFYGTSLYVWAAVLSVTLGGLAGGYFVGGALSGRFPTRVLLFAVLAVAGVLTALMPVTAPPFMAATHGLGVRLGALTSAMLFMLPPLACMGMVSPLIIQLATESVRDVGRTAGTVYAVSTVGGILMTLLVGFYIIPALGIRWSVAIASLLVSTPALVYFLSQRRARLAGVGLALVLGLLVFQSQQARSGADRSMLRHRSEGLLGQIAVIDYRMDEHSVLRRLLVNLVPQTLVTVGDESISRNRYVHRLAAMAAVRDRAGEALLLGFGGGSVALELLRLGYRVDAVEIDGRMLPLAEKYFGFEPPAGRFRFFVDDARHYLRTIGEKDYDLIVVDLLNGETQPFHVFTLEGFEELRAAMKADALLLVEFQGPILGEEGKATRSLHRTMREAGFRVHYHRGSMEGKGDTVLAASVAEYDFSRIPFERMNPCCRRSLAEETRLVRDEPIEDLSALILRDDQPVLEILNRFENEQWRGQIMESVSLRMVRRHDPLFE